MKPHPLIIHNRAGLPVDNWYQIEVTGEHHNAKADVMQVIDGTALDSMVKNFDRGNEMLIDIDHFSHDQNKETRAYGWLKDIRNREGQLEGQIEWTKTGEPAVLGKDYKFFSTEYDPKLCERISNKSYRPLTLSGLALTNRPNNVGGKPIMNRDIAPEPKTPEPSLNPNKPNKPNDMNAIATALGLAEDATEEEILAAISKLTTKGESQEEEIEQFQNREADRLVESYAGKIGENTAVKAHWKEQLITNREATVKVLSLMPDLSPEKSPSKPAPQRLHNRAGAIAPASLGGEQREADEKQARLITNRCTQLRAENPNRSFNECWAQAESENA